MFIIQYKNASGESVIEKVAFHESVAHLVADYAESLLKLSFVQNLWMVPGTARQ